jgi:hypothetical protein
VEAALACRLIWSDHMPDGPASVLQSGIIIVEAKVGRLLMIVCGYPICG